MREPQPTLSQRQALARAGNGQAANQSKSKKAGWPACLRKEVDEISGCSSVNLPDGPLFFFFLFFVGELARSLAAQGSLAASWRVSSQTRRPLCKAASSASRSSFCRLPALCNVQRQIAAQFDLRVCHPQRHTCSTIPSDLSLQRHCDTDSLDERACMEYNSITVLQISRGNKAEPSSIVLGCRVQRHKPCCAELREGPCTDLL